MTSPYHKEVVLGVTGSIAAFKACEIASELVKKGYRVTPVLTRSACKLVCPATFEAITQQRVITELFEPLANPEIEHISVANRANLFLIAPATANIIAKAALGIADDWLSTTLLATRAPILFAPAMNSKMYEHPATQHNIATLKKRGCLFVGPISGRLACGTEGIGKMAEPETIIQAALPLLDSRNDLMGKHILITSGPTREPIDPVRFISNRSSGKMGYALAWEALLRKATVTVISGPTNLTYPYGTEVIAVETATEMEKAALELAKQVDVIISAAAVADYRPEQYQPHKIKKTNSPLTITLLKNPDILQKLIQYKKPTQIIVGFAAETEHLIENALQKMASKPVDFLVANQVGSDSVGFGSDNAYAYIIDKKHTVTELGNTSKQYIAQVLFDKIVEQLTPANQ